MTQYDVFNGDADGICSLQQLRLAHPRPAQLVTGVKRDIALLQRVPAQAGDSVTVLDISLHRNRAALDELLARGAAVEYFDHHHPGAVPVHRLLRVHLDPAPALCTSLLVDRYLQGRHRRWAIVGAFGDNLEAVAETLALREGLGPDQLHGLRALGEAINYNAYGETEADLAIAPARLAQAMRPFAEPLAFAGEPIARRLVRQQARDLARGLQAGDREVLPGATVVQLPDEAWARRVQGALANALSLQAPGRAHAVLRPGPGGSLVASVRAPQRAPRGADDLCLAFPGGGGRAAAAGIDALPRARLPAFIAALATAWPREL